MTCRTHRAPSADVQTGVAGGAASNPTATYPRRHCRTDATRVSGSSGERRRQSSPAHDSDAGGAGIASAMGCTTAVADAAGLGSSGAVVGIEGGGGVTEAPGIAAAEPGSAGLPHGLAIAIPTKAMNRTIISVVTRRSFRPPAAGDPWNEGPSRMRRDHPGARSTPVIPAA